MYGMNSSELDWARTTSYSFLGIDFPGSNVLLVIQCRFGVGAFPSRHSVRFESAEFVERGCNVFSEGALFLSG